MTGFEITVIVLLSFLVIVQVIYIAVGLWIALTEDEMEGYDSNHKYGK